MMVPPRARKAFGDAINRSIATILQWWPRGTECASASDSPTFAGQADLLTGRMTAFGLEAGTVARVEPITSASFRTFVRLVSGINCADGTCGTIPSMSRRESTAPTHLCPVRSPQWPSR